MLYFGGFCSIVHGLKLFVDRKNGIKIGFLTFCIISVDILKFMAQKQII